MEGGSRAGILARYNNGTRMYISDYIVNTDANPLQLFQLPKLHYLTVWLLYLC